MSEPHAPDLPFQGARGGRGSREPHGAPAVSGRVEETSGPDVRAAPTLRDRPDGISGTGLSAGPMVRGRATGGDRGSVSAETAVVLPVLVLVLAVLVFVLACVAAQLRCVDAARSAARLAARGETPARVEAAAREAAPPGADVRVSREGDQVLVVVDASVEPFGRAARGLASVQVRGRAVALDELSVTSGPWLQP